MALSSSVIDELKKERERAQAEKLAAEARIRAIDQLLGFDMSPLWEVLSDSLPKASDLVSPKPLAWPATVKETVATVLRQHPGWKAANVTDYLRKHGYKTGGETRLSHRVYNEIWRMVNSGEIEKMPDGGFRWAKSA